MRARNTTGLSPDVSRDVTMLKTYRKKYTFPKEEDAEFMHTCSRIQKYVFVYSSRDICSYVYRIKFETFSVLCSLPGIQSLGNILYLNHGFPV